MFRAEDLELITGSILAVIAVGTIVFTLVGAITFVVFYEREAPAGVPKVIPSSTAERSEEYKEHPVAIAG